jgi:hypothetical protein
MAEDEVQLGSSENEDYEVVPIGPIRKLERRLDEVQQQAEESQGSGNYDELVSDVIDIMKSNQKIVNDMTESTHELKNSVEDLTHKMDETIDNMNAFMDLLNEASEMDMEDELVGDMEGRIADAIGSKMQQMSSEMQQSNEQVVEKLSELNDTIRKSYASSNVNSGNQRSRSQPQRPQSTGQSNQGSQRQKGQNQQGQQRQRGGQGRGSGLNVSQDGGDRLDKLREKFDEDES